MLLRLLACKDEPGAVGETVDLSGYVSDAVTAVLGPVALPGLETFAVRDAPVHVAAERYPVSPT